MIFFSRIEKDAHGISRSKIRGGVNGTRWGNNRFNRDTLIERLFVAVKFVNTTLVVDMMKEVDKDRVFQSDVLLFYHVVKAEIFPKLDK